jgi:hypothetical protein
VLYNSKQQLNLPLGLDGLTGWRKGPDEMSTTLTDMRRDNRRTTQKWILQDILISSHFCECVE